MHLCYIISYILSNYDLVICTCYFIWKCDVLNCGSAHYAWIMIEHICFTLQDVDSFEPIYENFVLSFHIVYWVQNMMLMKINLYVCSWIFIFSKLLIVWSSIPPILKRPTPQPWITFSVLKMSVTIHFYHQKVCNEGFLKLGNLYSKPEQVLLKFDQYTQSACGYSILQVVNKIPGNTFTSKIVNIWRLIVKLKYFFL